MASGPGEPPLIEGLPEPDSTSPTQHNNKFPQTFGGPLNFEDDNDDQQVLVEHDHSQYIRRNGSREEKSETVSSKLNGWKTETKNGREEA